MPYLETDGARLYYEEHGQGAALVFLHGAGANHMVWYQQVPAFRDRYRCITLDQRGFGWSSDETGESAGRAAADLEALLDAIGVESAALVAQSMGGWTALGFALCHPGRVRALVMADTHGGASWPELDAAHERSRRWPPDALPERVEVTALGDPFRARHPEMALLYAQIASLNPPEAIAGFQRTQPSVTRSELDGLAVPVLFVVGSDDPLIPAPMLRMLHEALPGSEYREFAGLGHSVYFEDPAGFNAAVAEFLDRHA